jgi:hypothetical protein
VSPDSVARAATAEMPAQGVRDSIQQHPEPQEATAGTEEMPAREVPEAMAEWLVISPAPVGTGEMVVMEVLRAHRGTEETVARAMQPRRMEGWVEMAEIRARRELVRLEVWRVALELQLGRMEPMAWLQPVAAMAAMAEMDSQQ